MEAKEMTELSAILFSIRLLTILERKFPETRFMGIGAPSVTKNQSFSTKELVVKRNVMIILCVNGQLVQIFAECVEFVVDKGQQINWMRVDLWVESVDMCVH
jgi:hypothetical protein